MFKTISRVLPFGLRKSALENSSVSAEGFTYAIPDATSPMHNAEAGEIIRNKNRRPLWLIVNHEISAIIIPSQWPGRLWRVEIVDTVKDSDVIAAGSFKPIASAGYTRAVSIRLIEELPLAMLFGLQGEAVCTVVSRARTLTLNEMKSLASARHPDAGAAYTRAWKRWLSGNAESNIKSDEDYSGTLLYHGTHGSSPINRGFAVAYTQLSKRAEELVGASAFVADPIDSEGVYLEPTWAAACDTLLDAALAFGAPSLLNPDDYLILATAWQKVIGEAPPIAHA